ncbi:MAG: tyrosine-protein phosphatase [Xanthomonadales bacterium]|nr:tyrosine-protein phosphatase [Xanthomonadales bacterium]MDH4020091.1 tyrosine-protein phosphatase [Xanthomonadales bacterium]
MWNVSARKVNRVYMAIIFMGVWMLATPAFSSQLPVERVIHLDGTANTRDIGGYITSDLRTLRWGQIIRSENLSRLTASDFQKLEEIGVKTVIDLRTDKEHDKSPTVWLGDNPPEFFHFPVGDSNNDWFNATRKMMKGNKFTEEQSSRLMVEGYRMIVEEGPPSYEKLMEVVLDQSNWPILIHCNAGKDRAGVAVTLIMEALGVDRAAIMEEFLLTNEIARIEEKAVLLSKQSKKQRRNGRGPSASAWFPVIGVQPEMLEAFYAHVDEQYGSMDAFLTELGVDQDARKTLAASLTTEQPLLVMSE